jgi:hypothetical protein
MKSIQRLIPTLLLMSALWASTAFAGVFGTASPEGEWVPPTTPPVGVTLKGEVVLTYSGLHHQCATTDPCYAELPTLAYAQALVGLVNDGGQFGDERYNRTPDRHGFYVDLGEVNFTDATGLITTVFAKVQTDVLKEFFNRTSNLKGTITKVGTVYTAPVVDLTYSAPWGTYVYDYYGNIVTGGSTVVEVEIVVEKTRR